ncbi:hypothetical protein [Chachezhania sediminis]|uniref:hypothetical protein n=1 Tax=Chachezhania sediminis TaxID=2599291 RepID=UPI0018EEFBD7|nr:hypothetical protein [Chachezhania sediminis]
MTYVRKKVPFANGHPAEVPVAEAPLARKLDQPLNRPERPCARCGRMFQPTTRRLILCHGCFVFASGND